MATLGAIQSNYLPWRGYFDFIKSVDVFVLHDCIQYTKQDWRNRNRIKTPMGTRWITVPVQSCPVETTIDAVKICGGAWVSDHRNALKESFSRSRFKGDALSLWESVEKGESLSLLNARLLRSCCDYLGIKTPLMNSRGYGLQGAKTDRLIDMCKKVGADTYLSGPSAKGYLDVEKMRHHGIRVEWKEYYYPQYEQPWGAFDGAVTVLDLIANTGMKAKDYL